MSRATRVGNSRGREATGAGEVRAVAFPRGCAFDETVFFTPTVRSPREALAKPCEGGRGTAVSIVVRRGVADKVDVLGDAPGFSNVVGRALTVRARID